MGPDPPPGPDEEQPGKATSVTLATEGLTALSNMPEKHRCYLDGGAPGRAPGRA